MHRRAMILAMLAGWVAPAIAQQDPAPRQRIEPELMAKGFDVPWSIGFLPGGAMLVTERGGRLWYLPADGGARRQVSGVPQVAAIGQGGLLDLMVPRDFAQTREVIISYAAPHAGGGAVTALAAGRLSRDGAQLEGLRVLFEAKTVGQGGRHFGGRVVEGPQGHLFLTIGERGTRPSAQDPGTHNGTVIRLARDGSVPPDNPFVGREGALPEIWSYGHRNPQGAAFDMQGRLWVHEHGARGGDEVNLIRKGANYGWPVIAYGRHYSGARIGEGTHKEGMEQPEFYWDPSIAPSGFVIHSGQGAPEWRGDFFVGSLKFDMIAQLRGAPLREVARLHAPETLRTRALHEGPGGALWIVSEGHGAIYRLKP
ncbi:MAG: PQQ-dependent sugar dehydrogenase [Sediminimonas qiaohouensis]|uniref:PQQ-dependent sugar dehydrogenase n=2 Tax=Sediminimonas qiaohouensis TaxID=552061 RepID=A0A7C9M8Q7_9RHOB|nr:PQQ-dependent sugar dehydrogenase [Sediminimonas qiaohouensis]